jgi:hypothetical protein
MPQFKQYFTRRLSIKEAAAVVLIVALLAGLCYGAYQLITAKVLEAKVNAAMPKVCADIREQRNALLKAIEAYRAHFGIYPPDNVISRQPLAVDPVKNPLLYELAGVVYNPTNKTLELIHLEAADAKYVKEFFHCDGLKNCGEDPGQVKRFLTIEPLPARQLHDDPDVLAVGFTVLCEGIAPEVIWEFDVSPWRYVSSAPTNNPGKFDLWNEVKTKNRRVIIGNWRAVE